MSVSIIVTGDKELDRLLSSLPEKVQKKIARKALNAGLSIEVKAMRGAVPANMNDMKKAIGKSIKKSKKTGVVEAKAGAAVGIKKAKMEAMENKQKGLRAGRPGVGIGARNIHWFILGTEERTTGSRKYRVKGGFRTRATGKAAHPTGRIKPNHFIRQAAISVESQVYEKMESVIRAGLEVEVAKR